MLDAAQKFIGTIEVATGVTRDPGAFLEAFEGDQRLGGTQLRLASAGNQLLGLGEEFYLADAAATDFDVVTGDADFAKATKGMDLALHGMNVGDGGKVEVFAPDEWRQILQQAGARGEVAGDRARLDQGRALPVLPEALVIVERGVGR